MQPKMSSSQQQSPRYSSNIKCNSCGYRVVAGGYPDEATIAQIEKDHQDRHKTTRPTHTTFTVTRAFHAAEITHVYDEDTSGRQTTTSTSFVDVPNMSISSASFTAGEKYLIVAAADLDNSNVAANSDIQTVHGTTAFAESFWSMQPNTVAPAAIHYQWWTVWTAVSGEGLKLQYRVTGSGTAGVDLPTLFVMKLTGDLTENTDWFLNAPTPADTTIPSSSPFETTTGNAAITFTPATANDIWLILSESRVTGTNATIGSGSKMVRSGEASSTGPYNMVEGEDADDSYIHFLAGIFQLGASSNTFTEVTYGNNALAGTRKSSAIFALNLSKFKNVGQSFDNTNTNVTQVATGTPTPYGTQTATTSITPTVANGNVWVFGFVMYHHSANGQAYKMRVQFDDTDLPANQTTRGYFYNDAWDATDETTFFRQGMASSVSAAAHTIDMDMQAEASQAGRGFQFGGVAGVTMELAAAAAPSIEEIVNETEAISENVVVWMKHMERVNETEAIQEAVNIRMNRREVVNEPVSIAENVVVNVKLPPKLVNETEAVTENVVFRLGRLTVVSETTEVGENVVIKMNRITPPVNETEQITEQVIVKVVMAPRIVNETEQITENIVYRMNMARVINETESILENVVATVKLPAKVINETEAITENVVVKLALAHVINETEAIQESIVYRINRIEPPINETLQIGENIVVRVNNVRPPVNETEQITENVIVKLGITRPPINETVSIDENVVVRVNNVRPPINETETITEQVIVKASRVNPPINETEAISEQIVIRMARVEPPINEMVGVTENVVTRLQILRPVSETEAIQENVIVKLTTTVFPVVNETLQVGENVVVKVNRIEPPINEPISIPEQVIVRTRNVRPPVDETVGILENIVVQMGIVRPPINEPVAISENVVVKLHLAPQIVNEQVSINEATLIRMDRVQPPINEPVGISEDIVVRMNRVTLQGEQLNITEDIIVKLISPLNQEVNEAVSISENITIKVEHQDIIPAPVPGGGGFVAPKPTILRRKRTVWPQMSLKTYDPTKYVQQDKRYERKRNPTPADEYFGPRTKVRRAFTGIYDILPVPESVLAIQEQNQQLDKLLQTLQDTNSTAVELAQNLTQPEQKPVVSKPRLVSRTFVAKYDILAKIKSPIFTGQYDKTTLVSKTFIASYDIKTFDWAKLNKLQYLKQLLQAMSQIDELDRETIEQ